MDLVVRIHPLPNLVSHKIGDRKSNFYNLPEMLFGLATYAVLVTIFCCIGISQLLLMSPLLSFKYHNQVSLSLRFSAKDWWTRKRVREYLPIITKDEPSFVNYLKQAGIIEVNICRIKLLLLYFEEH